MAGTCGENAQRNGISKGSALQIGRYKKGRLKELVKQNMTVRGLQKMDAQDHTRWRLGCKYRLAPA